MTPTRFLILAMLVIGASFSSSFAQTRWQRLPAPRDPQFYVPRNKLEEIDGRHETVLVRGRTWVGSLRATNGSARVEATEIHDSTGARATGAVITVTAAEQREEREEIRSMIDYEEIDALVRAIDTATKASDSVTKLTHFEVRYRTRGDFEIMVFKQLSSGSIAAAIEVGFYERTRLLMSLDDLTKLRWMIVQAKEKIDEMK